MAQETPSQNQRLIPAPTGAEVRKIITDQQSSLLTAHNLIKKYRDAHEAVNA